MEREAGGLLSLGPNLIDAYRRAAAHLDKILKDADPIELPVQQPTTVEFGVNVKTARALGLSIHHSVRLQATHVIQ